MEENSKSEIFKFLTNQPLGEDLFENKSQDKIAQVISDKIINDPEFKIIGIDGEWGSGKSNLVRLLDKKLESTHKFFVYDVWGHQEDEQRKSILVELTEFIKNEPYLLKQGDKKIWDDKLKVLLAKSKETTTINQPYLSIGFIFSLLSIVYIPTVNVFKDSIKDFLEIESWFWKIVLVTFPLIIVVGIYLWNVIGNWRQKNGFWNSFKLSAEETFQVYTNKQKEETKIETVSEDQPSVRDFQNWMNEINDDLNKKVVIVFDNFDRLPKKHILNIWSSIHIFFAEKSYSNIKVIIPFDREHIQNAFKELNGSDTKFGDDYVNKTFDIVFRITLPIMSNWKKFFTDQWKKAFINYDEDELRLVVQVYEFLNRRITPREIISFINEILTIKLLDNSFKERYVAIFVLKKDDILKNPLNAITNLEYLKGLQSFYSNDKDFAKQLTAIVYHIDVENAIELIYTQELRDSMNKNDVEQFNTICKSEFIDSIFNSAITELEILENPILTLSKLAEETNLSKLHISQAWDLFYSKILKLDISVNKLEIAKWQVTLIKNSSDDRYLRDLINKYIDLLDESNIEHYIDLIDDLIIDLGEDKVLKQLTKQEITENNFIKLVEYKGENYKKYKLTSKYNLLDNYLSQMDIENIIKLRNSKIYIKEAGFKKYKEHLIENFNNYIDQNVVESANEVLMKIKETVQENGDLENILEDSKIYTFYLNNSSVESPLIDELIAMRIAKADEFRSSYATHFRSILNIDDADKAEIIATMVLQYISYDNLLLKSNHFKNSVLFKQIILKMFENLDINKNADVIKIIEKYKEIKESLEITDDKLIVELDKFELEGSQLNIDELDDEFVNDCFNNPELSISNKFFQKFNEDFKHLQEESYKTVFADGLDIHFKYFDKLDKESLTQSSLDIFEKQFLLKLKESSLDDNWWKILSIYNSNNSNLSIINSLKNIRDQILNSNVTLNIATAKLLLPYFIGYDVLSNLNDVFRLIIKNEFLSDSDFNTILFDNSDYIKKLYQNTNQSEKEGFRNVINEKRESNDLLEQLARKIDIRKPKGNSDNQ